MKKIQSMLVSAALAIAMAAPASAAATDPEIVIYRASGVIDTGSGSFSGVATVFQCTNISAVTENLRFVIRNFNTVIVANQVFTVPSLQTQTASTHFTALYANATLAAGISINGTVAIAATTPNIFCTARTVDASAGVPSGIILPMVRFNPIAGSEE